MKYSTPEKCGISSANIKKLIDRFETSALSTHNVIIARGDTIVFEKYWEPFHKDFLHRMYSVSKSFVSLAVGFAVQDGLFSLDDKMIDLFPQEMALQPDENIRDQTVRNMLMMATGRTAGADWFRARTDDRVALYFREITKTRPAGTTFLYDSTGSFVLGALVERKVGMPFMEYLRVKLFDKIGVSKEAHCLKCPGGHSWGDSAVLCTPMDLLLTARFVLNGGRWNGKQILNEQYISEAVSDLIDTDVMGVDGYNRFGYGYLFWRTYDGCFFFNGMGNQFAVCVPHKDIIFIYNGDNQGYELAKEIIFRSFFELIVDTASDEALPEEPKSLEALEKPLRLMIARGSAESAMADKINGKRIELEPNPMGIKYITLHLSGKTGEMEYENAQGIKNISFGIAQNVINDAFPQEGYSKDIGGVRTNGHFYRYAGSAAWTRENTIHIKIQVIDEYFGRLDIRIQYLEDGRVCVRMVKTAEDFLDEYNGITYGRI